MYSWAVLSGSGTWERLLLPLILAWQDSPSEYFGSSSRSLPARSGSPKEIGSPLAEHAGMERVAERTLSLPDRALHLILSDPAEDDFLTFIGELR